MSLHIPPALKHRRFFYLWLGLVISVAGTQMQLWALFWHIRTLTDQPIALGGIGLARILPVILFSLLSGVVADSYNRRKVMFFTQSAAALQALALGLLTQFGDITIWHIYALTALQAVVTSFDGPARQALVPNLVSPKDLPNAFSLTSMAHKMGAVVGPALSGVVIYLFGQQGAYYINALSFLAVLAAILAMGSVSQAAPAWGRGIRLSAIGDGIRFMVNQPIILSTMLLDFVATFFASANTLMPIIATDILKVGVLEYGWLSAAQSVGALGAALVISQVRELRRQGQIFLASLTVFGLATILFGMTRSPVVAWGALAVTGAADAVSTIIRNTIRQLQTPDPLRGRMTSINQLFVQGGPRLGEIEAGAVAQFLGAPAAIITGGIGCLVGMAMVVSKWPQLFSYNFHDPALKPADAA